MSRQPTPVQQPQAEAAPAPAPEPEPAPTPEPEPAPTPEPDPDPAPAGWLDGTPDDWREQVAQGLGGDERFINQLNRIPDVKTAFKRLFDSQDMIRSGQIEALQRPGEDATEEQWQEYRDSLGVPAEPGAYAEKLALDEGLALSDEDQAILEPIFEVAHEADIPADKVSGLTNAFLKARAAQEHQFEIQQEEYRKETVTQLNDLWRGATDTNLNLVRGTILNSLPESIREDFEHAYLPNGRKLFNTPEVIIAMADWARQINPAATVVPSSGNPMKSINDEIEQLESRMGSDEWYKDEAAQARYRELIEAKERMER